MTMKILSVLLAFVLVFALVGCNNGVDIPDDNQSDTTPVVGVTPPVDDTALSDDATDETPERPFVFYASERRDLNRRINSLAGAYAECLRGVQLAFDNQDHGAFSAHMETATRIMEELTDIYERQTEKVQMSGWFEDGVVLRSGSDEDEQMRSLRSSTVRISASDFGSISMFLLEIGITIGPGDAINGNGVFADWPEYDDMDRFYSSISNCVSAKNARINAGTVFLIETGTLSSRNPDHRFPTNHIFYA